MRRVELGPQAAAEGEHLAPARAHRRAELGRGQGILLVSTDFEEVAAICHRALVFRDGAIVEEIGADGLSTESITLAASLAPAAGAPAPQPVSQ